MGSSGSRRRIGAPGRSVSDGLVVGAAASREGVLSVAWGNATGRRTSDTRTTSGLGRAHLAHSKERVSVPGRETRSWFHPTSPAMSRTRCGPVTGPRRASLSSFPGGKGLRSRLAGGFLLPGAALSAGGADSLEGRQGTRPGHCRWSSIGVRLQPQVWSVAQPRRRVAVERRRGRGTLKLPRGRLAQMVRALR